MLNVISSKMNYFFPKRYYQKRV